MTHCVYMHANIIIFLAIILKVTINQAISIANKNENHTIIPIYCVHMQVPVP